jgi:alkylation response protein AidB-like acyl-CoA dehydrogenase
MQLDLTQDQSLLHETTLRFVEAELPLARTRELHDDPRGFDRGWLAEAAALGWFAMLVPEELGGGSVSGVGLLDAALVADVVGRHVQPGPFIQMNVVASALAAHGSARLQADVLPAIVAGELVATWACAALDGATDDGAGVRVVRTGDDLTIRGARGFVPEAQSADHLLVTATLDGAPTQVLVPAGAAGVALRPLAGLDLSRRFAHVDLDDVVVPEDALLGGGAAALEAQLQVAVSLAVSDTVGAMDALFAMTVDYAKGRIAFGRPVGSFQAIKHLLADQAVYLESCKAVAVAAASAAARGDERAGEIVSMAAAYVGDQGRELAQVCLQVHGGIGYTWEHDLHLLMRRIQSNASLYGEPTWHRERVCSLHRLGEAGEEVAGA